MNKMFLVDEGRVFARMSALIGEADAKNSADGAEWLRIARDEIMQLSEKFGVLVELGTRFEVVDTVARDANCLFEEIGTADTEKEAPRVIVQNKSIDSLGLSTSITNALRRAEIEDLWTLQQKSARELRKIRCIGGGAICKIRTALEKKGLKLAGED